jgi:hypothetical protein
MPVSMRLSLLYFNRICGRCCFHIRGRCCFSIVAGRELHAREIDETEQTTGRFLIFLGGFV